VPANLSILDALAQAGIDASAGCRNGSCGTCATRVLAGEPDHRDSALTDEQRTVGRLMCVCVSRAHSPGITLDL
jgi:vanillate monooxygenase ferredoxin subunit